MNRRDKLSLRPHLYYVIPYFMAELLYPSTKHLYMMHFCTQTLLHRLPASKLQKWNNILPPNTINVTDIMAASN